MPEAGFDVDLPNPTRSLHGDEMTNLLDKLEWSSGLASKLKRYGVDGSALIEWVREHNYWTIVGRAKRVAADPLKGRRGWFGFGRRNHASPVLPAMTSKIGGQPYMENMEDWPLDQDGKPLRFYMQINFAELEQRDEWPSCGILTVFMTDNTYDLVRTLWYPSPSGCSSTTPQQFECAATYECALEFRCVKTVDSHELEQSGFFTRRPTEAGTFSIMKSVFDSVLSLYGSREFLHLQVLPRDWTALDDVPNGVRVDGIQIVRHCGEWESGINFTSGAAYCYLIADRNRWEERDLSVLRGILDSI